MKQVKGTFLKRAPLSFFMVESHSLYCCFKRLLDLSEYKQASSSNSSENPCERLFFYEPSFHETR